MPRATVLSMVSTKASSFTATVATQGRGFDCPASAPSVKVIRGEWVNREPLIPDRQRCLVGLVRRMGRGQGYTISEPVGSGTSAALLPCGRERCGQGFRRARPSLAPTRAWAGGLRSLGAAAAEEDEPCASPRDGFAAEIRRRPGTDDALDQAPTPASLSMPHRASSLVAPLGY